MVNHNFYQFLCFTLLFSLKNNCLFIPPSPSEISNKSYKLMNMYHIYIYDLKYAIHELNINMNQVP